MRIQAIRVVRLAVEGFDDAVVHWHVAERETGMNQFGGARLRKTKGILGKYIAVAGSFATPSARVSKPEQS
jgi:hypothetical protein